MPCVSKCCCCCNLKYGNFAYGTICLLLRICTITTLFLLSSHMSSIFAESVRSASQSGKANSVEQVNALATIVVTVSGYMIGWMIATSVALFIALKGIVQERSILLYPYIVVLICEIIVTTIAMIFEVLTVSPWILIQLFVVAAFDIYVIICLVSLYQHMNQKEKSQPMLLENNSYKTV